MRVAPSSILFALFAFSISCGENGGKGTEKPTASNDILAVEPVLGLWKSGEESWSTMDFRADGSVRMEYFHGDSFQDNWRRVEGSVYKIEVEDEFLGGFHSFQSSTSVPEAIEGGEWVLRPAAAQYYVWSDGLPESEWLPPITVEGDQLQFHHGDYFSYYDRVK